MLFSTTQLAFVISLQPRLNRLVLLIKVVHVRNEIFDDIHVRERVDFRYFGIGIDFTEIAFKIPFSILTAENLLLLPNTGQGVDSANVHGTGATDTLTTGSPEGQGRIHLVFDFNQGIQNHGSTSVQVDLIFLHLGLVSGLVGIPAVNCKLFALGCSQTSYIGRGIGSRGLNCSSTNLINEKNVYMV